MTWATPQRRGRHGNGDWLTIVMMTVLALALVLLMLATGYRLVWEAWPAEEAAPQRAVGAFLPRR